LIGIGAKLSSARECYSQGGVIWITGLSASGKTTVGRKVKLQLDEFGYSTIFLDGDELRSIFGGKWGYDRDARVDLAKVYFRLCNHLSEQGYTVIICAVAMYSEIEDWIDQNISNAVKILLNVPEEERIRRDASTKNVYASIQKTAAQYEEPRRPHLVIDNHGEASPGAVADRIVHYYLGPRAYSQADKGRQTHWSSYYSDKASVAAIQAPSPFAAFVDERLPDNTRLLEVGCGNGRDARHFARRHSVIAIDRSEAAIETASADNAGRVRYIAASLPEVADGLVSSLDVVYTRFVLHAMTLEEELAGISAASQVLRAGGEFWIECRSINDPLALKGEVISATERIHGHYRRFIVADELVERLKSVGFEVNYIVESNGLAVFADDDPVVIRVCAIKA
jgi:adenylylsulfate kinase-like enzyme/SAM-dependent methyltransferase